jgi:hypothetical protein
MPMRMLSARRLDLGTRRPVEPQMLNAYLNRHPDIMSGPRDKAGKDIRIHTLFHSFTEIMGICWPPAEPRWSFALPKFVPDAHAPYLAGGVLVSK